MAHPRQTITSENIAALIGTAWPKSLTPENIMAGFRKSGAFPLNPGVVDDCLVAPFNGVRPSTKSPSLSSGSPYSGSSPRLNSAPFSPEEEKLYCTWYKEGYNLYDSQYAEWLAINRPVDAKSCCSMVTHVSDNSSINEVLKLPQATSPKRKRKPGFNTGKSVPITKDSFLENLVNEEDEKMAKEEEKKAKQLKKERKHEEKKKAHMQLVKKSKPQQKKRTTATNTVKSSKNIMSQNNETNR